VSFFCEIKELNMSTIAKFLPKPPDVFSTQISSSTFGTTDLTVSLDSTSGLPTEGVGQFFKKDANGDLISGSVEFVHWTNVSGSTLTFSDTGDRGITGSDSGAQAYVADDYFEVWVSSYYVGGYGGVVEHNADGTHVSTIVKTTGAQTLTDKRLTKRVTTITSNATPTVNTDNCDAVTITALATAITSMTTNLSGTPTNFQPLLFRIKDDGTARGITWGASFEAKGTALPTTTVLGKVLHTMFIYDTVTSKWGCVFSQSEA
jgi:hypothetical protein